VQIIFAVSRESATFAASSAGLLMATNFAASSFLTATSIRRILLSYARIAEVHEATADVYVFFVPSVAAASLALASSNLTFESSSLA
jgi:hypothetical protein